MSAADVLSVGRTSQGMLIRVVGRGTSAESPTLEQLVSQGLQEGENSIGVDLTDCEYLDSTFLGCLVAMHHKSQAAPADPFVIIAPPAARTRLFRTVRLDKILHFVDQAEPLIGPTVPVEASTPTRNEFGRHVAQTHRALAATGDREAAKFEQIAEQIEKDLDTAD